MNIKFKRFKTQKYMGLLLAFIISIGTTIIPVSAATTDNLTPIVATPNYISHMKSGQDYVISITAEDNIGIKDVKINYSVGGSQIEAYMTKNPINGRYEYNVPSAHIPEAGLSFSSTIFATDLAGLVTKVSFAPIYVAGDIIGFTTDLSPIYASDNPNESTDPPRNYFDESTMFGGQYTTLDEQARQISLNGSVDHAHLTPPPSPNDADFGENSIIYTIKDVLSFKNDTKDVVVIGNIAYFATECANPVIQSVIDGTTYWLYINGSVPSDYKIGDQVKLKGIYSIDYRGVPMLRAVTARAKISSAKPMAPEIVTIAYLKKNGLNMIGRFVKIKGVTLGTYVASGITEIKDATGSMNIYKAASYPTFVSKNDVVDLYAMVTCHGSTVQLLTGTKEANGYNVYDPITNTSLPFMSYNYEDESKDNHDVTVTNTEPPSIVLLDHYPNAEVGQNYYVPVTVNENNDIHDVAITYTIGENTISNQKMIKDSYTGYYEYYIPNTPFSTVSNFTFTITATDIVGLKTVSKPTTVTINKNPKITAVSPAPNSSAPFNPPLIAVTFMNAGSSPKVTYTLKNDTKTLFTDKEVHTIPLSSVAIDNFDALPAGHYTAIIKIVRTEDGNTLVEEWQFTVTE
ncbi:hypothetical protein [Fusibacter ferrireducens]|uniref:Uncharacterized protein n=1 Tax=Fusibacter ferrireducens TaxID=2785058 RepID=A0ABR9ZZ85_9FIRM|nr:hypothetical protein [Fusibacter ferrireducens]MBF4695773.1 hypothetical protein [Fusibacter ferrireducens]